MGVVQLVSTFESLSGMPADRVQNVIHVARATEPDVTQATTLASIFEQFWTVGHAGMSQTMSYWLSGTLSRAANSASISVYYSDDESGETPFGSPIVTETFNPNAQAAGLDYPEEVAAVISYHGDLTNVPVTQDNPNPPPAVIRPQSRRRGRMFVGPLVAEAGTEQSGFTRPSPAFRTDCAQAFKWMAEQYQAGPNGALSVWSKVSNGLFAVVGGYVDDAWDTQRRRGPEATTRTTFDVV